MSEKIDRNQVMHVAKLARLLVKEEEAGALADQLNGILSYMDKLNELDTTGIEPMAHAQPLFNAFREDKVERSIETAQALENAPDKDENFFIVPKVI